MNLQDFYESSLKIGTIVAFLFIFLEAWVSYRRKDQRYSLKESLANLGTLAIYQITRKVLFTTISFAALSFFNEFQIMEFSLTNLWHWLACLVFIDFMYYWDHRFGHTIHSLWAFHNIHHSSNEFNLTVSSRLSWIENAYRWLFLVPISFLGFPAMMIVVLKLYHRFYQVLVHTQYVNKLGIFELFFVTPSQHRVHHGRNEIYLDKNYGGMFNIWDRIFGTYQEEVETVDYGLVQQIETKNLIQIQVIGFKKLFQTINAQRKIIDKLKTLVRAPSVERKALVSLYGLACSTNETLHKELIVDLNELPILAGVCGYDLSNESLTIENLFNSFADPKVVHRTIEALIDRGIDISSFNYLDFRSNVEKFATAMARQSPFTKSFLAEPGKVAQIGDGQLAVMLECKQLS